MRKQEIPTGYTTAFFFLLIGGMVFFFSNYLNTYHFFAVEQNQLFLWSVSYLKKIILQPGGFALLTGYFLQQFYLFFYAGAAIVAFITLCVWWLCFIICRRLTPQAPLYLLALLPALSLTILHSDFFYKTQGTVAFLLILITLYGYVRMAGHQRRFLYAMGIVAGLFFLAGPVSGLFAVCVFLLELFHLDWRGWIKGLGIVAWSCLFSGLSVYLLWIPEKKIAFLPTYYYSKA